LINGRATARAVGTDDRGSGTLWVVALIGLIWSMAAMAMIVGGVRAARHRAYAAADLAALAAAGHVADGERRACGLAGRIARESGARLRQCVFHGRVANVVVAVEMRSVPGVGRMTATARARAGPVHGVPPGSGSGVPAHAYR
jgi:secretion/DNA translocation related TadE-like protein